MENINVSCMFCVMDDSDVEFSEPVSVTEQTQDDLEFERKMAEKYGLELAE